MPKTAKEFASLLNSCLDEMEAPPSLRERANIVGKIMDIPKQEAWNLLEGKLQPTQDMIQRLSDEFDLSFE